MCFVLLNEPSSEESLFGWVMILFLLHTENASHMNISDF